MKTVLTAVITHAGNSGNFFHQLPKPKFNWKRSGTQLVTFYSKKNTIELTRRGYQVTGIDYSESMLRRAKRKASEQKLVIDFQHQDARNLPFTNEFEMLIIAEKSPDR